MVPIPDHLEDHLKWQSSMLKTDRAAQHLQPLALAMVANSAPLVINRYS
jgi:hypothetical protein